MLDLKLYMAQRISAMIMGPLVLGHLAVMVGRLAAVSVLSRIDWKKPMGWIKPGNYGG